jgi:hypothetical protein
MQPRYHQVVVDVALIYQTLLGITSSKGGQVDVKVKNNPSYQIKPQLGPATRHEWQQWIPSKQCLPSWVMTSVKVTCAIPTEERQKQPDYHKISPYKT